LFLHILSFILVNKIEGEGQLKMNAKSSNEGSLLLEIIKEIISLHKIALHIVSYMTILCLFNPEPASR